MNGVNSFGSSVEAFGIVGLVALSYASTNLDNFLVLSAYSAKPGYQPFLGRLAFVSVCLTVILASLALARVADTLIADKLRYLGVIPLGWWTAGDPAARARGLGEAGLAAGSAISH